MIKGAVFDFDGTLFDSMYVWETIGGDYLRSIGYAPKGDVDSVIQSMSLDQAASYFRSAYGVSLSAAEIRAGVNRMLSHFYRDTVQPKEGAALFLRRLEDSGVKLCIASATDRPLVEAALMRCGMDGYFSEILTCASVGAGKDRPEIFREAAKRLGTEKKETFIFEDALYAIETAKKDGFAVIGVFDRYEKNQTAVREKADFYLTGFTDTEPFWKFASDH